MIQKRNHETLPRPINALCRQLAWGAVMTRRVAALSIVLLIAGCDGIIPLLAKTSLDLTLPQSQR